MAIITIKGAGKITVPDDYARSIKKDWTEMKQGLFPKDTVIEVGEYTGILSDIMGFIIEPERKYPANTLDERIHPNKVEVDRKIKEISDMMKTMRSR